MTREFAEKLCCPMDKSELELREYLKNEDGDILEGLFTCPKCDRYYPVIYGIPIMSPDEYREKALEQPFMEKRGLTITRSEDRKLLISKRDE